jgi:coenzyme F420-reducing hydrogenase delta subunit
MGVQKNIVKLKNKVELITQNLQRLILEEQQTRKLLIEVAEIVKLMPGYKKALDKVEQLKKEKTSDGEQRD